MQRNEIMATIEPRINLVLRDSLSGLDILLATKVAIPSVRKLVKKMAAVTAWLI